MAAKKKSVGRRSKTAKQGKKKRPSTKDAPYITPPVNRKRVLRPQPFEEHVAEAGRTNTLALYGA